MRLTPLRAPLARKAPRRCGALKIGKAAPPCAQGVDGAALDTACYLQCCFVHSVTSACMTRPLHRAISNDT